MKPYLFGGIVLALISCISFAGSGNGDIFSGSTPTDVGPTTSPTTSPATSPAGNGDTGKPIPNSATQDQALKSVREVFGEDIDKAKEPKEKQDLAKKLLGAGSQEQQDMPGRYVLLNLAVENANAAGDVDTAWDAIDEMSKTFSVDTLKLKADSAARASRNLHSTEERAAFVPKLDPLIDQALAADRYDAAEQLAESALVTARLTGDSSSIRTVTLKLQLVRGAKASFSQIKSAADLLTKDPTNAEANLTVGKFYCFEKKDWKRGLPMLALGGDGKLKSLALQELSGTDTADQQIAVGDAWWEEGEKLIGTQRSAAQQHSADLYQSALPSLDPGLRKDKVSHRIEVANAAQSASTNAGISGPAAKIDWTVANLPRLEHLRLISSWTRSKPKTTLEAQRVKGSLVLSREHSPYLVSGVLLVPADTTLTIEPGVVVLFAPQAKVDVQGTFTAVSDNQWIVLANANSGARWQGIDSAGKVELARCLTVGANFAFSTHGSRDFTAKECIFAGNGESTSFGNGAAGTVDDSLYFRNDLGPFGHGDGGTVHFSHCLLLFNKRGCTGNFYGQSNGSNCTFCGNDTAIQGADRGDFVRVTLSNIITTTGQSLGSRGGKAIAAGNYWGRNGPPNDPKHDVSAPAGDPIQDSMPKLPPCEYLSSN